MDGWMDVCVHTCLRVCPIDVYDGGSNGLHDVTAVALLPSAVVGLCGEAQLVVDYEVHTATHVKVRQRSQTQRLCHNALGREGSVTMHLQTQDLGGRTRGGDISGVQAVAVCVWVVSSGELSGPGLAYSHRTHSLQVGGIGQHGHMHSPTTDCQVHR